MSDENPDRRFASFRELVTHMLREGGASCPESDVVWYPATDAFESEDEFVVRMELCGVRREDLAITLRDTELTVRGVRRETGSAGRRTFHKMEIAVGPFHRRLEVPGPYARGETGASYRDGVLEIRFRRSPGAGREVIVIRPDEEDK